jgi:hypothetical protein
MCGITRNYDIINITEDSQGLPNISRIIPIAENHRELSKIR